MISDRVYSEGISVLLTATRFDITDGLASSMADLAFMSLGSCDVAVEPMGVGVVVHPKGGDVARGGEVRAWALCAGDELLASNTIDDPHGVTQGHAFKADPFTIGYEKARPNG